MKKVINFYKVGWTQMNPFGKWILLFISAGIAYSLIPEMGILWAIFSFFAMETVFIWKIHMDIIYEKNRKVFLEKKHSDDPDWESYKLLKKKFRGA